MGSITKVGSFKAKAKPPAGPPGPTRYRGDDSPDLLTREELDPPFVYSENTKRQNSR